MATDFKDLSKTDGKTFPYNLEAETSVIGSMMLDNRTIPKVIEAVEPNDFYKDSHSKIYNAIRNLFINKKPADLITVVDALKSAQMLDEVGGFEYLAHCEDSIPSVSNIDHYLKIIKDKSYLRNLIQICSELSQTCYQSPEDVDGLLSYAESQVYSVRNERLLGKGSTLTHIKDAIHYTMDELEKPMDPRWDFTGIPSGFHEMDHLTNGFQKSDLIIIAARPAMGKTSFVLNIAEWMALKNLRVMFFSLEMGRKQICQRLLCSMTGINIKDIRSRRIIGNESRIRYLMDSADQLSRTSIFIDDKSNPTIPEILAKCRRVEAQNQTKIDILIVDYLQLIPPTNNRMNDSRNYQIAEVVRGLKQVAKDLDIPVIAVAQLNRALEARHDKRPQLSDLRDSGEIEATADLVMFIHREEYYDPDHVEEELKGKAEVIIAKHRNGELGKVVLRFRAESTRFENPAYEFQEKFNSSMNDPMDDY